MNQIVWEHFDGFKFQKFCNELLLLEVSKFANVYSAPGPDGGIDQTYEGNYEGKKGKWRFQDKFHNSGNKNNDIKALKREIIDDITNNYINENFLIFITNINLTTRHHDDFIENAKKEILRREGSCDVMIWHGATIEALVRLHPILFQWYWGTTTTTLQLHSDHFKSQLSANNNKRNSFCNSFFDREKELQQLHNFLNSDLTSSLALVANGGYGKTRLCIEFMNQVMTQKSEWLPVVVVHQGYNGNDVARLMQEQKRLLVLLDNANEQPEIFEDIKRQVEGTNGKSKLLITTRNTLFNQTIRRVSSHNRDIDKIELKQLTPEDTLRMLEAELPFIDKRNLIALRNISKGVPNVLIELIRAIKNGKQPIAISRDNFFTEVVLSIVNEAATDTETNTGINRKLTFELLQLLSVLSPLNNQKEEIDFIAATINCLTYDVQILINELHKIGIIEKYGKLSIKPDPYSDVILLDAFRKMPDFIKRVYNQDGVNKYIENIIKNLSEAELPNSEIHSFTQRMLHDYFDIISDGTTNGNKIKSAFELANDICIAKPEIAVVAIHNWIALLNNKSHPIHIQDVIYTNKSFVSVINDIVKSIFNKLYIHTNYKQDNIFELHQIVEAFIKASNDYKVLHSCYNYEREQFKCLGYNVHKCCELQFVLKDIATKYLISLNEFQNSVALEACDVLLQMEFQIESYYDHVSGEIHYGHYTLPECDHSKQIRIEVLDSLIGYYKSRDGNQGRRETLFSNLTRHLFYCTKASTTRYNFNTDQESELIINFLKSLLNDSPTMQERSKILAATGTIKGEFKEKFIDDFDELRYLSLKLNSAQQELELLLNSEDYFDHRINAGKTFLRLIEEYNDDEKLQEDLLSFSIGKYQMDGSLYWILQVLIEHKQDFAKSLFERVLNYHINRIGEYSCLIKAFYQDNEYFKSVIQRLDDKQPEQLSTIVWMLIYGRCTDTNYYEKDDIDYFELALNTHNETAKRFLNTSLIQFVKLDKERVFLLLGRLISNNSDNKAGFLHTMLTDEDFTTHYRNETKYLLDKHLSLLPINESFGGDEILTFIENKFDFETLYSFIRNWLEAKAEENDGYFFSDGYPFTNPSFDSNADNARFIKAITKYVSLSKEKLDSRIEKQILKKHSPKDGFTDTSVKSTLILIQEFENDREKLFALAKGISIFPPMTEALIISMCHIATAWLEKAEPFVTLKQVHEIFGTDFYLGSGSKSKTGKGPYIQDVQRKNLLESILSKNCFPDLIKQYLQQCLLRVNKDIQDEIDNDINKERW